MSNNIKISFVDKHFNDEGNFLIATELDNIDVVMKLFRGFASAYYALQQTVCSYHYAGYIFDIDRKRRYRFDVMTYAEGKFYESVQLKEDEVTEVERGVPYISKFNVLITD